jgi:hypothetical protein
MRTPAFTALAMAFLLSLATAPVRADALKPPTCADSRAHEFDFWLGDWEVTAQDKSAPGKPRIVGFNRITPILDGCVLQEHWHGISGSAGSSLNFYDSSRRKWRQFWVWREGTTLELEGARSGNRMVMEGDSTGPDGRPLRNRITWFDNGDGTVRQLWEVSGDGGQAWRVEFDGLYRQRD